MTQPNMLLLMTDQQRWDTICNRTGCNTPSINRIASEGVSFERSYTPVSLCCPARAMLLSGAYNWHNGVFNQVHVPERMHLGMHEETVTYAMRLRDAGYRTGYVGKWHAHWTRGPLDYGYARASDPNCYGPEAVARSNFRPDDLYRNRRERYPTSIRDQRVINWPGGAEWPVWIEHEGPLEGRHAHFLADRTIDMLQEFADQDGPWLLEMHSPEPHDPFQPHVDFAGRYDWRDVPLPETWHEEAAGKPAMNAREAATYDALTEEDVRQAVAHYWAYTEEVDYEMGRVLDALEATGQADNTLVVCTTDHGELLGDHHMFIKGWMPYEGTHRIPLVVSHPTLTASSARPSHLVQLHDLAHTFCELGGAEQLPYRDGVSLSGLLADPSSVESRDAIMNTYYGGEFLYTQRILITGRYKYVFNGFDIDELYDLQADPDETINRISDESYADVRRALRERLYEKMEEYDDPYRGKWLYHAGRYLPG